jgi:hypothetical protein
MNPGAQAPAGRKKMTWLTFAMLTVVTWGLYGLCLHTGAVGMSDPANGRIKAFLLVGVAYFLIAVLAPVAILFFKGATWGMPGKGLAWSLIAGTVGAVGALGVILAFGAGGKPPVVMSIIFAGAPVVNALVSLALHSPEGGWAKVPIPFFLGIVMAATGGYLVTAYKPKDAAPARPAAVAPAAPEARP